MTPIDTNKLPAEVLMAMARRAVDELSHGNDDFDLIHPDTPRHKDIVCAMQAAYDASPGPGLEAENARLREVFEAARRILERWDMFLGQDGWGNQADAYYSLAKGASNDWETLRTAIARAKGE